MATLGSFVSEYRGKRISASKIDVEGGELAVLFGAKKILRTHRSVIVCEVMEDHLAKHGHPTVQLIDYMSELDYDCRWLSGEHTQQRLQRLQ